MTLTNEAALRMNAASPSLPWFTEPSPWGGPIASPALLITALTSACTAYRRDHPIGGVPVDGAYELRNLHGPLFLDRPYRVWSEVIGRGQSPKTEYIWYESHVADEADRCGAELRMQLRFMKRTAGPTLLT